VDRSTHKPDISHTPNRIPSILYVGRISREKNLDALCKIEDFHIRIVGDGPDRARLEKTYPHVKFLGYKTGTELANEYVSADVFAFPSKTDTFGIVIIEALAQGTPVAAYPVPGPIDILTPENGVMDNDLKTAIIGALSLSREEVKKSSEVWTWEECWRIFKENLV
jgi:glycosyltransferase involved in cell wall biosynthesis